MGLGNDPILPCLCSHFACLIVLEDHQGPPSGVLDVTRGRVLAPGNLATGVMETAGLSGVPGTHPDSPWDLAFARRQINDTSYDNETGITSSRLGPDTLPAQFSPISSLSHMRTERYGISASPLSFPSYTQAEALRSICTVY